MSDERSLDLLIVTFGLSNGRTIEGRTRIQKLICNLQYGIKIPLGFDFRSYYYGPYSDDLAELISDLVDLKILDEEPVEFEYGRTRYDYKLTKEGFQLFEKTVRKLQKVDNNLLEKLRRAMIKLNNVPTPFLIDMAKEASHMESTA